MELQNLNNGEKGLSLSSKDELSNLALSERKIAFCTEEQIKQSLRYIFILIGCTEKDLPNDIEKSVLISYILETYSLKYTAEELKTAFKYAVEGRFTVDLELYGKRFNSLYLSRVMKAYDEYKSNSNRSVNKEPSTVFENNYLWTDESKKKCFDFVYGHWKENKQLPNVFPADIVIEVLIKSGVDLNNLCSEADLENLVNIRAYAELSDTTKRFGYDEFKMLNARRTILSETNKGYHRNRILVEKGFEKYTQDFKSLISQTDSSASNS